MNAFSMAPSGSSLLPYAIFFAQPAAIRRAAAGTGFRSKMFSNGFFARGTASGAIASGATHGGSGTDGEVPGPPANACQPSVCLYEY
jgi:hypothetical protein